MIFPITYSVEGPPFTELVERMDGILLDTNGLHHIGSWDETPDETRARVEAAGFELEVDGEDRYNLPFRFYRGPLSGLRIELIDAQARRAAGRGFGDTSSDAQAG
jgi:hypothetical protein